PWRRNLNLGLCAPTYKTRRCRICNMQKIGRGERIRTSGPCLPKTVLYQAELLPDRSARRPGSPRRQGGPLDAQSANFKRQSAHSMRLPRLHQFGSSKAEMTVRHENQMIDQVDAQGAQEERGIVSRAYVGVARQGDARGVVVRHHYRPDPAAEQGSPA